MRLEGQLQARNQLEEPWEVQQKLFIALVFFGFLSRDLLCPLKVCNTEQITSLKLPEKWSLQYPTIESSGEWSDPVCAKHLAL